MDARDESINQRKTFGHWEGNLIVFSQQKTNVITLRERKTRYRMAIKNENRKAQTTTDTLVNYMKKKLNQKAMHSLTVDNDTSFAQYTKIAESLNMQIYVCDPYQSYQKRSIENANRLLRTKLPRQTNLTNIEQTDIKMIVTKFNNKPMKCLGYQTLKEVFYHHLTGEKFKNRVALIP